MLFIRLGLRFYHLFTHLRSLCMSVHRDLYFLIFKIAVLYSRDEYFVVFFFFHHSSTGHFSYLIFLQTVLQWISEYLNHRACVTSSERDPFLEAGLLGPSVKYSKVWRWCSAALQKRRCECAFPPTVCGETQLHYFLADVGYYWSLKMFPVW